MKLHALERELPVAHPHGFAVFALSGDFQAIGQAGALDRERMIAGRAERRGQAGEHPLRAVAYVRGLAVHHPARMHDAAAEGLAYRLMPEAYAEYRQPAGELADQGDRDAGFAWGARPGGDDDARGVQRRDAFDVDGVVAHHPHLVAEFAEILHQVVGEGIVVVDHQQHDQSSSLVSRPAAAISAARSTARALFRVSCHSDAGSESATMPAPACMCSTPSLISAVRSAIARSMSP